MEKVGISEFFKLDVAILNCFPMVNTISYFNTTEEISYYTIHIKINVH